MKLEKILFKKRMNKKGFVQFVWAGAALVAAGAWLISIVKPKPVETPTQALFSSVPIYVWIMIGLFVLVLVRSRN